jgi:hypothetical protein
VQKMLFALMVIACVMVLSPIASQRAEATPAISSVMVDTASTSFLPVGEWHGRRHRTIWPFWLHRHRYQENDFDRRHDGYLSDGYRRDYVSRSSRGEAYRTRSDYSAR